MDTLWRIASSMQQAGQCTGVEIITGDTKVVDNGKPGDDAHVIGTIRWNVPGPRGRQDSR